MNNQTILNKDALTNRVSFLQEIISQKVLQFNEMLESLKKFEGYSTGSKEIVEKTSNHIKKQQAELDNLVTGQKISPEISKFISTILESVRSFVRLTCGDAERQYFSKQGELLFLQQEVEKLANTKLEYEQRIKDLDTATVKTKLEETAPKIESLPAQDKSQTGVTTAKKKRVRPDQDPTTRAGRAALDIAERRKKYQKKLS